MVDWSFEISRHYNRLVLDSQQRQTFSAKPSRTLLNRLPPLFRTKSKTDADSILAQIRTSEREIAVTIVGVGVGCPRG
jgi:hypothetical protein